MTDILNTLIDWTDLGFQKDGVKVTPEEATEFAIKKAAKIMVDNKEFEDEIDRRAAAWEEENAEDDEEEEYDEEVDDEEEFEPVYEYEEIFVERPTSYYYAYVDDCMYVSPSLGVVVIW